MSAPQPDNLPFPALPDGKFTFASIDPPWSFAIRGAAAATGDRRPDAHYPTATIDHLKTLPVSEMMEKDALIAMWITGPLLVQGVHLELFSAWGFDPSSLMFVWIKTWNKFAMTTLTGTALLDSDLAMGGGYTTRSNAEYVLLGKRGKAGRARADIRQVIVSNRREHSRKPEEFYRRCDAYIEGRKIDMFGGAPRPGWTHYGYGHRPGEAEPMAEGFAA